jgi:PhnO protein
MDSNRFSQLTITIRDAVLEDAPAITELIKELAETNGENSLVTISFVQTYLNHHNSHVLLAEVNGEVVGFLSYSIRPDLYHAGDTAMVEELIVHRPWRGQGVGSALIQFFLAQIKAFGCIEASVSTMDDNERAIRFYRAHGLEDEALLLEKHFLR